MIFRNSASDAILSSFSILVAFWHNVVYEHKPTLFTAMTTAIFSQKNVCAALGLAMAITIVIKAKAETNIAQQTARFETTKPTPQIGYDTTSGPEALQVDLYKTEKSRNSETC